MKKSGLLLVGIVLSVFLFSGFVSAVWWNPFTWFSGEGGLTGIPISGCINITESGRYYLANDIDGATPFCLNITASNVSIDLNGKKITGNDDSSLFYLSGVIKTCQDLQDINNDSSGYYILANDIDCSGFNFQSLDSFSGTLDGLGHRILNLDISSGTWGGPFINYLLGGGSLKNVRFEGNIVLGNSVNPFALISSNYGVISNVYVNLSNRGRTGFVRDNVGIVEDTYVNMNLLSNLGGLVENNVYYNTGGKILNSYSASGGLVGRDILTGGGAYGVGIIINSSYGGTGNCLGSGSSSGCTLQVLPAPEYNPQGIEDFAILNSAIFVNGVRDVSLNSFGNIKGFSRVISALNSNVSLQDYENIISFDFRNSSMSFFNQSASLEYLVPIMVKTGYDTSNNSLGEIISINNYSIDVNTTIQPKFNAPARLRYGFGIANGPVIKYNGMVPPTGWFKVNSTDPFALDVIGFDLCREDLPSKGVFCSSNKQCVNNLCV